MTHNTLHKASQLKHPAFFLLLAVFLLTAMFGYTATYYVDAVAGNDNNNGTSEAAAWRTLGKVNGFAFVAGDIIRFKRGQTWSGQLVISRAGTSTNVITFTNYGSGNRPLINAGGALRDAIFVANSASHIVVDGFAVTNFDGANVFDGVEARRTGIHVGQWADPPATMTNIKILNNEVYFVEGMSNHPTVGSPRGTSLNPPDNNQYQNGAICVDPHNINGITIQGNYIHDCTNMGILACVYSAATNLVIRSNSVYNVGSDGIVVWNTQSPLLELNAVINAGNNSGTNPRGTGVLGFNGLAVCGIWTFQCNSPMHQYNYCEGTKLIRYDGQPWDFDIGVSGAGVYQYNYSRDNEGGFNLGGLSPNDAGFVYRYNISINDGSRQGGSTGQGFFNGASQFYNNVFYRTDGKVFHFDAFTKTTGTFKNNIFYSPNSPAQTYVADGRVFNNNCFFGHTANSPGTSPVLANPNFVNVANAAKVPPGVILNSPNDLRNYVNGFKLNTGSPCINTGTSVANGGLDFWGNTLYNGLPDIGANETTGAPPVTAYSAKRTLSAITVDGNLAESVWGPEINFTASKNVLGTSNNTVTFGSLWTPTHLYVAVRVLDGNLFRESANNWDDDGVEIYIDPENNGGAYGANDRQYVKVYNTSTLAEINGNTANVLHGWTAIPGGYTVELGISWSAIGISSPAANLNIGFDIGVNDDDNGAARDHQQMWRGDANNWQSTANFGDLTLSATTTGSAPSTDYVAKRTLSAITVDGNLSESVWGPEVNFTASKSVLGTPNNTVTYGALWTPTHLYVAVRVLDGNLFRESTNTWDDDAVEVYIDPENNGGAYGANDRQYVKVYNTSTLAEIHGNTANVLHGWAAVAGGYTIELGVPWSALGISSPAANFTIGFDIGVNDDDNGGARDHQQVWKGDVNNWQSTSNFGDLVLSATTTGSGGSVARPATENAMDVVQKDMVFIYPNPVNTNTVRVQLQSQQKMPVNISIVNSASQKTINLRKFLQAGSSTLEIPVMQLKNGVYLITIDNGKERISKKLVIAR